MFLLFADNEIANKISCVIRAYHTTLFGAYTFRCAFFA